MGSEMCIRDRLTNQASMMNKIIKIRGKEEYKIKTPDYKNSVQKSFKNGLVALVDAYISLKDALVKTDKDIAKQAAIALSKRLGEMPTLIKIIGIRSIEG